MKKLAELLWKQKNRRFTRRLNKQNIKIAYDFPFPVEALGRYYMGILVKVGNQLYVFITKLNPLLYVGQELKVKKAIFVQEEVKVWGHTISLPCLVVAGVEVVK